MTERTIPASPSGSDPAKTRKGVSSGHEIPEHPQDLAPASRGKPPAMGAIPYRTYDKPGKPTDGAVCHSTASAQSSEPLPKLRDEKLTATLRDIVRRAWAI